MPFEPQNLDPEPIELSNGRTAMVYDHTFLIGWPLTYFEISSSTNAAAKKTYRPLKFCINLLLILVTLFAIIYSIQTLAPKFSIKTMLIATACVALLFPVGQIVFSTDSFFLQTAFIFVIYFAPVVAVVPAFIFSRVKSRRRNTDNKAMD